jgi:hypothetical protein
MIEKIRNWVRERPLIFVIGSALISGSSSMATTLLATENMSLSQLWIQYGWATPNDIHAVCNQQEN